jgi:tetratricopeptide (TPR) repeat protein
LKSKFILTMAILLVWPASSFAYTRDELNCNQGNDADLRIAGCSGIINQGSRPARDRGFAYNNRAIAWLAKGDADKALADAEASLRLFPGNPSANNSRGNALVEKKRYDEAIAEYDKAIKGLSRSPIPYNGRARAWMSKGDPQRAIADASEALKRDPNYVFALNIRGSAYNRTYEHDLALADFNKCIKLSPGYAHPYNGRALAYQGKEDYEKAIADYNQSLKLDPKNPYIYSNRGTLWLAKGEFDIALSDFNEALRLDPLFGDGYADRGNFWRERGDYARALSDLNEAIRLNPLSAAGRNNRGILFMERRELDRAIEDFSELVRADIEPARAYANRGEAWRLKGDLDRALADQNESIRRYPKPGLGYLRRGDTYRYRGEFEKALADYSIALKENDDYVAPLTGRGLTYEKMGDYAKARADFEKAVASKRPAYTDIAKTSRETAISRLAALDAGVSQPVIPALPPQRASETAIPTPTAAPAVAAIRPTESQGRRVALVIGNSTYQKVPALPHPKKDAEVIAASLRNIGFETVTLKVDATRENVIDALRGFANEAEKADWAAVYYAGHGIEVNGQNYLIPVDAKLAVDRDVQFEAIPLEQVLAALEGARKLKLIMLDACRDNPFTPQMRKTPVPDAVAANSTAGGAVSTRSIGRGLGEVKVTGASLVVFAAKHGQTALDGEGVNSPFAVALVQRIATPGVEINKIFRLVRDDVMEATAGRQEPYTYGSLPGREDFFFVASK